MNRINFLLSLVVLVFLLACSDDKVSQMENDIREGQLDQREQELKKKEEALRATENEMNQIQQPQPINEVVEIDHRRYGYSTGSRVNFRKGHSLTTNSVDYLDYNEKVEILDEYIASNISEAITKRELPLYSRYGGREYVLVKGKGVIIEENLGGGKYLISYENLDWDDTLYAEVYGDNLDVISNEKWYKIRKLSNGKVGWVLGRFLSE